MKDVVFRVKGEVYGKTLLPLPQGIDLVDDEHQSQPRHQEEGDDENR